MHALPTDTESELRQRGSRVAGHIELRDIRTFSLSATANTVASGDRRLRFDFEPNVSVDLDDNVLVVQGEYSVDIIETGESLDEQGARGGAQEDSDVEHENASTSDDSETVIAELRFTMASLYSVRQPDGAPFTDVECDAFAQTTGQFALFPYVRQLVAELTTRLQLPPLTLPVYMVPIQDPNQLIAEGLGSQDE